jgi:hypothetical protein
MNVSAARRPPGDRPEGVNERAPRLEQKLALHLVQIWEKGQEKDHQIFLKPGKKMGGILVYAPHASTRN